MSVRTRSTLCALTVGIAVLAPSAALAEPRPHHDGTPSCSDVHSGVRYWPGTGHGGQPVYSDAYESSLMAHPACAEPGS